MKNFLRSTSAFIRALPNFVIFELLYRLIMVAIGYPSLVLLLKVTMKASGIKYLSDEHILVYLKNPATLLVLLMILIVLAVFSFVELTALITCFSCRMRHEKITIDGMFRSGLASFRKAFRGSGVFSFIVFMAFMPMAQFTMSSGVFMAPILPMLRNAFRHFGSYAAFSVYILIQLLFVVLIAKRSYTLHYLVLTDSSFHECSQKSRSILNGKQWRMTGSLILWSLFMLAAAAAITFIISFIVLLFIKGFTRPQKALLSALKALRFAVEIFSAVSAFLSAPAIMCWLTGRFFADVPDSEKIITPKPAAFRIKKLTRVAVVSTMTLAALLLNITYLSALYKGNVSLNVGLLSNTQITAHRGASKAAPENTMYAFQAALDSDADYIELDVQLTKDEQLVVFHDEKIDRVSNKKGSLNNYTYAELQRISVGEWFGDGQFADARVPLFSDVLELVGHDILLNIEIKDHGNTSLTVQKTVELIQQYDIVSSCYITSFSYKALKQVKQLDPRIKTGLIANAITTMAFNQLKYIDALSLNHLLVNQAVINSAHQSGKRVFVWTVDRPSEMQNMIALGVDNIITNRPDKAAEAVYSRSLGGTVLTALKTVFGT